MKQKMAEFITFVKDSPLRYKIIVGASAAAGIALIITASIISSQPEIEPEEKSPASKTEMVREEQPEEVNAVEHSEAFYTVLDQFIDLKEYEELWLQLAEMPPMEGVENPPTVWFGITSPENAEKISAAIIASPNWASALENSPQTPEEQDAARDLTFEDDLLNLNGVIHTEEGDSLTVNSYIDESSGEKLIQYSFSVNTFSL